MKSAESKDSNKDPANYDKTVYEKPSVTVDIVILTPINCIMHVLLVQRKYPPHRGCWALPGGFIDVAKRETLIQAAQRELYEETNLECYGMIQGGVYDDPDRDPRMRIISIAYYTIVSSNCLDKPKAGSDAKQVKWYSLQKLPKIAFDHKSIINDIAIQAFGMSFRIV